MKYKYLVLMVFFSITICYCNAQDPGSDPPPPTPPSPRQAPILVNIDFHSNHDYYLTIDGKSYGKLSKVNSKTFKLPIGTHKLLLESAETGEVIKPTFYLDRDMIRKRDLSYKAEFQDSLTVSSSAAED